MKWWVSTDWHKDHLNIMLPEYESRPPGFEDMLVERHNEVMSPEDGLLCLGDVVFGMEKERLDEYLARFNCRTIVLIRGNHDKKRDEWYLNKGFSMVCDQMVIRGVLFSHHPTMLGLDHILNVHGHHHRGLHRSDEKHWYPASERHVLLSAEYADYYPVSIGDLIMGKWTVDNKVYFSKGCRNGYQAREYHLGKTSSP